MLTLSDVTKDFLSHCQFEKRLSIKTLKAYDIDLRQLRDFFYSKHYPEKITAITKHELRSFIVSISELKPKSIKRKIASIKAMFNYLEFEDLISVNPFRKMRIQIKEGKVLPKAMDIKELKKIFAFAYSVIPGKSSLNSFSDFEALRNIVIIELLFSTGARVSEIANLREDMINLDSGIIRIKGKGEKERVIQICNAEAINILKRYSKLYGNKIEKAEGHFLVNRFRKKLSEQSIRGIVKKISQKSGVTKHVTPHMFRHSFATLLLEKDVDIKYIQTMLGHSSITTTQIYTQVNRGKQKQILKTKHPRRDFSMINSSD